MEWDPSLILQTPGVMNTKQGSFKATIPLLWRGKVGLTFTQARKADRSHLNKAVSSTPSDIELNHNKKRFNQTKFIGKPD